MTTLSAAEGRKDEVVTQYMTFRVVGSTPKTKIWHILNNRSGGLLGKISWYGPWRQYCLFPAPDCVFNKTCLDVITAFLKERSHA